MAAVSRREDPEQRRPRRRTSGCSARSSSGSPTSSSGGRRWGPRASRQTTSTCAPPSRVETDGWAHFDYVQDARLPLGHLPRAARRRSARSASATTWASRRGRRCRASTATRCAASSSPRATPSRPRSSSSACSGKHRAVALRPAQPLPGERRGGAAPLGDGLPAAPLLRHATGARRPRSCCERRAGDPDKPRILGRLQRADRRLARLLHVHDVHRPRRQVPARARWRESGLRSAGAHHPLHAHRGGAPHVRGRDRRRPHRAAHAPS